MAVGKAYHSFDPTIPGAQRVPVALSSCTYSKTKYNAQTEFEGSGTKIGARSSFYPATNT